jgi:ATP-dependent Clp protease ATP-binding subunit ClpB
VGKTELAKALAEFLFDDERAIVRLDMSEYTEKHTVSRMIGAPPGYVGFEESGQLTEAVRRRPYSVVLLDEIEKAHAEIFNVLLQLLDDGRLTDGQGRTISFAQTVVIMTSNLGSHVLADAAASGGDGRIAEETRREVQRIVEQHFRPEFLNRIDEIILFHPLARAHVREIVGLQVASLVRRLADRHVHVEVGDDALDLLAEEGYDAVYGARPLRRLIQRTVANPLAVHLLSGEVREGSTVRVGVANGRFAFETTA